MSTVTLVPERAGGDLSGADAARTVERADTRRLIVDAVKRLRGADGTSHARSLAWAISLIWFQALVGVVGFATALGREDVSQRVADALRSAMPDEAGTTLTSVLQQANSNGAAHRYGALIAALLGMLVTGTTAFGQVERAANRIYGVERDRPMTHKYGFAFLLTITAGLASLAAFVLLGAGRAVGTGIEASGWRTAWNIARWPLGLALLAAAITAVFRWSPNRHQPSLSWMAWGASVSVVLWLLVTIGFSIFLANSDQFGEAYGPVAGVVALLLWSYLSSLAVLYGLALAAQMEAVRRGVARPTRP